MIFKKKKKALRASQTNTEPLSIHGENITQSPNERQSTKYSMNTPENQGHQKQQKSEKLSNSKVA